MSKRFTVYKAFSKTHHTPHHTYTHTTPHTHHTHTTHTTPHTYTHTTHTYTHHTHTHTTQWVFEFLYDGACIPEFPLATDVASPVGWILMGM